MTRSAGMTLVEVVVAMVLAATLLGGILRAYGLHQRQARQAAQRLEALSLADSLLDGWESGSGLLPREGAGIVRGSGSDWSWTIVPVGRHDAGQVAFDVARLELRPFRATKTRLVEPFASLEFALRPDESAAWLGDRSELSAAIARGSSGSAARVRGERWPAVGR